MPSKQIILKYRVCLVFIISQLLILLLARSSFLNIAIDAQNFNLDSVIFKRILVINTFTLNNLYSLISICLIIFFSSLIYATIVIKNANQSIILFLYGLPISIVISYFILNSITTYSLVYFRYPTIFYHVVIFCVIWSVVTYLLLAILYILLRKEDNVKDNKLQSK